MLFPMICFHICRISGNKNGYKTEKIKLKKRQIVGGH